MIKATIKLLLLALWILACLPAAWLAKKLDKKYAYERCVLIANKGILWIIGIRVEVSGELSRSRPLLAVSNHISYLDVFILGSQAAFKYTPKAEVASWPWIGALCRLQDCIFIDRRAQKLVDANKTILQALTNGNVVIVFPEATTSDGLRTLPFKSGFFSLIEDNKLQPIVVQPIAITYTHIWKLPIDSMQWPDIAWYGDMELMPHLWNLLKMGGITAKLSYLPPIKSEGINRKQLAKICEQTIAGEVEKIRKESLRPRQKLLAPVVSALSKSKS